MASSSSSSSSLASADGFLNMFPVCPNTLVPVLGAPNNPPAPGGLAAPDPKRPPGAGLPAKLNRPPVGFGISLPSASFAAGYVDIEPNKPPPCFGGNSAGLSAAGLSAALPNKLVDPEDVVPVRLPKSGFFSFTDSFGSGLGNSLPPNMPPVAVWNFLS